MSYENFLMYRYCSLTATLEERPTVIRTCMISLCTKQQVHVYMYELLYRN